MGAAVGANVLAMAKTVFYPVNLMPKMMPARAVVADTTEVETVIDIATGRDGGQRVSHATLRRQMEAIVDAHGDPPFGFRVEYRRRAAPKKGLLFQIEGLRVSDILRGGDVSAKARRRTKGE